MWRFLLLLWSWLIMPAGDLGLYREVGGGTTIGAGGVALGLDTTDLEHGNTFSRNAGEVTVKEACRVLCIGGLEAAKAAGSAETALMRIEVDQNTGTFIAEPGSYNQGYFSDANGVTRTLLQTSSVVSAVAGAKFRLYAETKASDVTESADRTFLQLYRLPPELQIIHLLRSTNLNTIGTTYTDLPWNSEIIKDSLWTHSTSSVPAETTWTGAASRVLLLLTITMSNPTGVSPDRMEVGAHVLKNGTAIDFSQSAGFIRGTGDDINFTARLALPLDLATSDVIKVQVKVFARPGTQTARVVSNRATMTMIALPGNSNWIRTRNSANQDADTSSLDFACNTEDEKGPAFTHSTSTNNPEITLNRSRITLVGYQVAIDRGGSPTADNMAWEAYLRKNNTTNLLTRGAGGYSEGTQASVAYRNSALVGTVIVQGVAADLYELRIDKIGSGADSNADFLGGTGETKSLLWALDLDDVTGSSAQCIGEAACVATLALQRSTSAIGLGEGLSNVSPGRKLGMEARALGEGLTYLEPSRKVGLEGRVLGEGLARAEASRLVGLEARALGESLLVGGLSRLLRFEAQALAEAFADVEIEIETGGGGGPVQLLLEGRILGEAYTSLALGIRRGLTAHALGESFGSVGLGIASRLQAIGFGEAAGPVASIVLRRCVEARGLGEAFHSAPLARGRTLSAIALGEALGSASMRLALGIGAITRGEAITALQIGAKRFLEARTLGEAHAWVLVLESISARHQIELVVTREVTGVVVVRTRAGKEILRTTEGVEVPWES